MLWPRDTREDALELVQAQLAGAPGAVAQRGQPWWCDRRCGGHGPSLLMLALGGQYGRCVRPLVAPCPRRSRHARAGHAMPLLHIITSNWVQQRCGATSAPGDAARPHAPRGPFRTEERPGARPHRYGAARARTCSEVSGSLVGPPVFNTGEGRVAPLAGSIPVHLRSRAQASSRLHRGSGVRRFPVRTHHRGRGRRRFPVRTHHRGRGRRRLRGLPLPLAQVDDLVNGGQDVGDQPRQDQFDERRVTAP